MPTLTITFRGLCLFVPAPRNNPKRFHVFLAQPDGMPHLSRLRYQEADGSWTATDIAPWSTLKFGTDDSSKADDRSGMSNFSKIAKSQPMPEHKVGPGQSLPPTFEPHDYRGSHVVLHGGTLVAEEPIGVWELKSDPGAGKFLFPYILTWTRDADHTAKLEIWNVIEDEAPSVGKNSTVSLPSSSDPAGMAKHHFMAYFNLVADNDGPPDLEMTGTIPPSPPKADNPPHAFSLIVSSCPSGGGDGEP